MLSELFFDCGIGRDERFVPGANRQHNPTMCRVKSSATN